MQNLQQELDPSPQGPEDHPVLRGLIADQAAAYADEVRALRQRVAELEAHLAAAKASPGAQSESTEGNRSPMREPAPGRPHNNSVFTEANAPAVVAVAPATANEQPETTEPVSDPGFAAAWSSNDDAASFEERIAEKAFFRASSVDEQSREWLLAN